MIINRRRTAAFAVLALLGLAVTGSGLRAQTTPVPAPAPAPPAAALEVATFAGGCFWCVESDMDKVDGVVKTISGFMGGHTKNPTYKQVVTEDTGHLEVVQVTFDPKKVSFARLVDIFVHAIDPFDGGGQFCDRGNSYRTAIFYTSEAQKKAAEAVLEKVRQTVTKFGPIDTKVRAAGVFTPAEDYHQDYYLKNPTRYGWYRSGCRRDKRLEEIWGKKPSH